MTKEEIIKKVKSLGLPKGSYVVFGSWLMGFAFLVTMILSKVTYTKVLGA